MSERYHLDSDAFHNRARSGPCFICEIAAANSDGPVYMIYEDDIALAFLDKYPILYGHTLVAARAHREQVTGDFTVQEYLDLQRIVYQVAEAIREEVKPERVYIFTLGSQQGNAHVHWHIVPLPPGVPYHEQQFAALRRSEIGVLKMKEAEMASLAARIRQRLNCGKNHGFG
ncbi:MAG: HIT family protein [Anaerolineae bacterium]|nr:HIT family protein [Anaerolineae bacterium]